ncbi:glycoside hydrolase family 25 protein [Tamlana sp. I1]|uniref:glycoside hydrolase family 25 protein n=1 Tax=Tamlana sp. I1 TaxID=2762061 RepID=UPI00188ED091|nr:GH25 family lysozyme [Tamlana sp. I1]
MNPLLSFLVTPQTSTTSKVLFISILVITIFIALLNYFNNKNRKQVNGIRKAHHILYPVLLLASIIFGFFYVFQTNHNKNDVPNFGENIDRIESLEHLGVTNPNYIFGIDISHYQGEIRWHEVKSNEKPIEFVFIRSTMGIDGKDTHYNNNWADAKKHGYIRGAYHYYRPNEDPVEQFNNFAQTVHLEKGDFPPILDIEEKSKFGDAFLRENVLKWLKLTEEKYGIKPVVYTGKHFYDTRLKGYIDEYPLWLAAYSGKHRVNDVEWTFHQFSETVKVEGIDTLVDGNDFKLSLDDLKDMCYGHDDHSRKIWRN